LNTEKNRVQVVRLPVILAKNPVMGNNNWRILIHWANGSIFVQLERQLKFQIYAIANIQLNERNITSFYIIIM
jgi:hypothetical protein